MDDHEEITGAKLVRSYLCMQQDSLVLGLAHCSGLQTSAVSPVSCARRQSTVNFLAGLVWRL